MDELLRYYEEELGVFGHFAREFRARYPRTAGALNVAGEPDDDPGVTRLVQSVALLTARIRKRLDDDYPQFTEALLDSLYPHYLRPLPSHTIVQVDRPEGSASLLLPRGTMLRARGGDSACRFRTVYDVLLAPPDVRGLVLSPAAVAPRRIRLPRAVTAFVSIGIDCGPLADPAALPDRLRLFVDGDASLRAALLDTLFLRCGGAWLLAGDAGAWLPLPRVPLTLAGFAEADAMLPVPARSHPALRLLTEYFCYPDKFHFIDVDLGALRAVLALLHVGAAGFTLHLGVAGAQDDAVRLLSGLQSTNLRAGCTPVINLFPKAGAPLHLSGTAADYPLLADSAHAAAYEIHSVDAVRLVRDGTKGHAVTPVAPLYADAAEAAAGLPGQGAPASWVVRRDHATAAVSPGHEMRIALLDADYRPLDAAGSTLSVDLTCSNRDLPARLPWGQPGGDLRADELSGLAPIRMLRKPSPGYRFEHAHGAHWRLVAHLAPHPAALCADGLHAFQRMLALYDLPRAPAAQRAIGGIVGLEHGAERTWMPAAPVATLMPGVAVRLTVDEDAYAGSSLAVFAQVLDRYFALHAQLNCYARLRVVAKDGGREILAGTPRLSTWTAP
jgi:type VI secretion system protein ImpG